jgi:predicted enzyme related to lactoylglutathione lyase
MDRIAVPAVPAGARPSTTTMPFDYIRVNAPDPAVAARWYEQHFNGRRLTESADRLMFGTTRFLFLRHATARPSAGSAVDHIAFSFADIETKLNELAAAGVTITAPVREVPGVFRIAYLEDPWGTRIELVEDPELLGFHHVHMRGPDPEQVFSWLLAACGGERTLLRGRIDAIRYRVAGFNDVWILVQRGDAEPTEGHAIDHISWRSLRPLAETLAECTARGVTVSSALRTMPLANGRMVSFASVVGPASAKIELIERPGLGPGE